jgi:hypothetical protein
MPRPRQHHEGGGGQFGVAEGVQGEFPVGEAVDVHVAGAQRPKAPDQPPVVELVDGHEHVLLALVGAEQRGDGVRGADLGPALAGGEALPDDDRAVRAVVEPVVVAPGLVHSK